VIFSDYSVSSQEENCLLLIFHDFDDFFWQLSLGLNRFNDE